MRDPNGVLVGYSRVARDITDRRAADAALELRDRAIHAVTQGILITDPKQHDNPIIFASPGFETLTGYTQADVLGRNCRFLHSSEADPAAVSRIRDAVNGGHPCTVQILNRKKDGETFWNELSISPVLGGKKLADEVARLRPDIKVLYVSGYTDDAVIRHDVLHAKVHFLQKPFSPMNLAHKVREVLDGQ